MTRDRPRWDDLKVGMFVLTAVALFVVGSLWIARGSVFGVQRVSYDVLMQSSAGLTAGDRVRFAGVPVGRIKKIELRPEEDWPVSIRVAIGHQIPVRQDSTATVASSGLMGAPFLQIGAGSPEAPRLPPGGTIRGESAMGLDAAMSQVQDISGKVGALLDQTSGMLETFSGRIDPLLARMDLFVSEQNAEQLEQLLLSLNRTADEVGPRIGPLLDRFDSIAADADGAIDGLPDLTRNLTALTEDLGTALGPDAERLSRLLESADTSLVSAREVLSVIELNRREIEGTLGDLREAAANLRAFSQTIKERPYSLVRIKPKPDRRPGEGAR